MLILVWYLPVYLEKYRHNEMRKRDMNRYSGLMSKLANIFKSGSGPHFTELAQRSPVRVKTNNDDLYRRTRKKTMNR